MNKNTYTVLILGLVVFFGIAYVGWKYYQQVKDIPPALTVEQVEEIKYDAGSRFSSENPEYARGLEYLSAGDYDSAVGQLKLLQAQFPRNSSERNIIDYSIGVFLAFAPEKQKEAIDTFVGIVTDSASYNPITRALAIEAIGRTYATTFSDSILAYIFTDPYFKGYLNTANGDYALAMYTLALEGYRISKTPITSARLAEKVAMDLYAKKYSSDAEKQELVKRFGEYLDAGRNEVDKMTDLPGYNIYRSEFLAIYGSALHYMVLAQVGPYVRKDVEVAYQEAYTLADDGVKPFVILRYGAFLSIVAPEEKEGIEELSRRLQTIPQVRRAPFDAFLRNIVSQGEKRGGDTYRKVAVYRSKSPSFDSYVRGVLAR